MRAIVAAVSGACFAVALGCATGGGSPPSTSKGAAETRQSQSPCLGTADGDCPSGNPMDDF